MVALGLLFASPGPQAQGPAMTVVTRLAPRLDVFQTASQTYALTAAPASAAPVGVYLNGLLMLQGLDYTLVGTALTFTAQTIDTDVDSLPIIQVMYWVPQ